MFWPRGLPALILTGALVLAVPAGAAKLSNKNSIVVKGATGRALEFEGKGCQVPVERQTPLPAKSSAVRVLAPKVGDRARGGQSRIVAVKIGAGAVTFTAAADSAAICGPDDAEGSLGPPASRAWSDSYDPDVRFTQQVQTRVLREGGRRGTALKPAKVTTHGEAVRRIRWKSFGGRTAVGTGRLKTFRGNYTGQNGIIKVVLSKPSRCSGSTVVVYGDMSWRAGAGVKRVPRGREYAGIPTECAFGARLNPVR